MQIGDITLIVKNVNRIVCGESYPEDELHIAIIRDIFYDKKGKEAVAKIDYVNIFDFINSFNISALTCNSVFFTELYDIETILELNKQASLEIKNFPTLKIAIKNLLQKIYDFKKEYLNQHEKIDHNIKHYDSLILKAESDKKTYQNLYFERSLKTKTDIEAEIYLSTLDLIKSKKRILNREILDDVDYVSIVKINDNIKQIENEVRQNYNLEIIDKNIKTLDADILFYKEAKNKQIAKKAELLKKLEIINNSIIEKNQPIADFLEKLIN